MNTRWTFVLVVVSLLVLVGCQSASPTAARSGSLLAQWAGPTQDPAIQFTNLANGGLILSHDLNSGQVKVKRSMWQRLSSSEQRQVGELIQQYQNRNVPRRVMIYGV